MKIVVFAGSQDAVRATIAAAFFDAFTLPSLFRALPVNSRPQRTQPQVLAAMEEARMQVNTHPQMVAPEILERAALVVRFGDFPATASTPSERWDIPSPSDSSLERTREVRDLLRRRVWRLVAQHGWYRLQPAQALVHRRGVASSHP
jgi:hypothetical protein